MLVQNHIVFLLLCFPQQLKCTQGDKLQIFILSAIVIRRGAEDAGDVAVHVVVAYRFDDAADIMLNDYTRFAAPLCKGLVNISWGLTIGESVHIDPDRIV